MEEMSKIRGMGRMKTAEMAKMGKRRCWRSVAATAAFCGVWTGIVVAWFPKIEETKGIKEKRGGAEKTKMVKMGEMERGGVETEEKKNELKLRKETRFLGNERILTTPAAETKLSLRDLRPGDLLATRWEEEEKNGTPGFWNHLAIVGTDGRRVVEAQKTADGVVVAPINSFLARYSEIAVFRFFDAETARRAAQFAESRVAVETILTPPLLSKDDGRGEKKREKKGNGGEKRQRVELNDVNGSGNDGVWEGERRRSGPRYSWSASLTPILRKNAATENCVSLVRRAFGAATGTDYRWKTPDDLARWDKTGDFAKIGRF